jgi:hypothetical protein
VAAALLTACAASHPLGHASPTPVLSSGPLLTLPSPPGRSGPALLAASGRGARTLPKFQTTKPWILSWAYDCAGVSREAQFQIFPTDADPNVVLNAVDQITARGQGVAHYTATGTMYLIVNTQCAWALRAS